MSNKKNKFKPQTSNIERRGNNRTERTVDEEKPLMLFSFKDFQDSQIPPGQSYEDWQNGERLADMLAKFGHICNVNLMEAKQNNYIKVYGDFPAQSKFKNPYPDRELVWAVVMNVGGQKARVAGHLIGHVFYVVFLDEEHLFFPSEKKNT
jgi:hypothetical protein